MRSCPSLRSSPLTTALMLAGLILTVPAQAQSPVTHYEYDANGNRTKISAPLGRVTVLNYDALNRLTQVTDPNLGQTRYGYNGQDRLTQVTDPRNLITRYVLDGLGNRSQLQSPDTGTATSTHDAAGNELTRTDAKGQITTTQYDALNRPTLITWQDGSQARYTWDQGPNAIGRLAKIEEITAGTVTASLQYSYTPEGRLATETRTVEGLSHSVAYSYSGGRLAGITFPSGRTLAYTRNGAGQITQVTLTDIGPNAGQTKTLAANISYHPFGGLKSWTDGAGQMHSRNQDTDGRPSSYSLGATPWLITYDAAGRINAQMDGGNAQNSGSYGYDPLDRLTSALLPSSTYGYGYDATGNRTSQTSGAATRSYQTNPASNRLEAITGSSPATYSHDANGSITGDGTNSFAYDARGRLAQATTAAGTTQYRVNALGQRVKKRSGGANATDTYYHYDQSGHLMAESDAAGKVTREYFWLEDTPLAVMQ